MGSEQRIVVIFPWGNVPATHRSVPLKLWLWSRFFSLCLRCPDVYLCLRGAQEGHLGCRRENSIFYFIFKHLSVCLSVYVYVGTCAMVSMQRPEDICKSRFFPLTLWVPGINLRSSGLVANALTCWAVLHFFYIIFLLIATKSPLLSHPPRSTPDPCGLLHQKDKRKSTICIVHIVKLLVPAT